MRYTCSIAMGPVDELVLSGGCARLAGIDEFLSSSWGVPVEVARPLEHVEYDPAQSAIRLASFGC